MRQDFLLTLLDFIKLIEDPNIERNAKDKAIKTIVKDCIDGRTDFGSYTRQDLKNIVDTAPNGAMAYASIVEYLHTHNTRIQRGKTNEKRF